MVENLENRLKELLSNKKKDFIIDVKNLTCSKYFSFSNFFNNTNINYLNLNFHNNKNDNKLFNKKIGFAELKIDNDKKIIFINNFYPKKNLEETKRRFGVGSKCYFLMLNYLNKNLDNVGNYDLISYKPTKDGVNHLIGMGLRIKGNLFESKFDKCYNIIKEYNLNNDLI